MSDEEVYMFSYKSLPDAHIRIGVDKIEKMKDGSLHLIAPSGQLAGVVKQSSADGKLLCLPKETSEDRIEIQVSDDAVVDLVLNVEVVENW